MSHPLHVLVIGEPSWDDPSIVLKASTLSVLQAAQALQPDKITLFLIGCSVDSLTDHSLAGLSHVDTLEAIVTLIHPNIECLRLAENVTLGILQQMEESQRSETPITHIIGPSNAFGKNVLPRVAALSDVSMISDVTRIIDSETFVRPIYAGNAYVTLSNAAFPKVITARPVAFKSSYVNSVPLKHCPDVRSLTLFNPVFNVRWVKQTRTAADYPELTSAPIVVAGGRGLKSSSTFEQLKSIARLLGAAIGASRAAVEAGFAPNDYQIGQTGKVIAPKVYLAVGISGAIQHIAGISDSQLIIAINSDPDAPIFKVADYGLIGDLFEILPVLEKRLLENNTL